MPDPGCGCTDPAQPESKYGTWTLDPARPQKTGSFSPRKTDITVGHYVNSEILKLEVVY